MKKIYLFAAAAALLTACSSEELSNTEAAQQNAGQTPVAFSIYTPRSVTRAGLPGTLTTDIVAIADDDHGFGVFAYYTNATDYVTANTFPNFMYNQQVKGDGGATPKWSYEPVKYWPNEFGNAATSDDIDRVTFFSYAPWTKVNVSTGIPDVPAIGDTDADYDDFVASLRIKIGATPITTLAAYQTEFGFADADEAKAALDDINKDLIQGTNIAQMTRNTATGDPIIKYAVDTNPVSSVDLLWGVAADDYETTWGTTKLSDVKEGFPFIDLVKPSEPTGTGAADSKVKFNLRHALAKLLVTIDYIADQETPLVTDPGVTDPTSETIDNLETKIFVRQITIGGFVMKGALNLNNIAKNKPNWKNFDGSNEITYEPVTFKDGRRDGKEGTADGAATNETYLGLNPNILQRTPYEIDATNTKFVAAWAAKNTGVTKTTVNLFGRGGETITDGDAIFVIPMDQPMDVEIVYDVETINPKLNGKLSDGITNGSTIENKIRKLNVVGEKMAAGNFYTLNIHLGMTSAKFDAKVEPWIGGHDGTAELPANQN